MIPKFKYTFQYFTFNLINEGKSQYFMTITYVTTCRKPFEYIRYNFVLKMKPHIAVQVLRQI